MRFAVVFADAEYKRSLVFHLLQWALPPSMRGGERTQGTLATVRAVHGTYCLVNA